MKILILGNDAREHALAWKFKQEGEDVYILSGNGGTLKQSEKIISFAGIAEDDHPGILKLARKCKVDLVVPCRRRMVVTGIADLFEGTGIACFAPSMVAAELEGFKAFAKDFMKWHKIPTAEHGSFITYEEAKAYLSAVTHRVVIKVCGVVGGKGSVLPALREEAQRKLHEIMVKKKLGPAGDMVVIEEFLTGAEVSILTFSDGITFRSLPPSQDYRRIFDGSKGPNTGGMGVCAPVDFVSAELMAQIEKDILAPTFQGLRAGGRPFRGMLFTGIMITSSGPKVLGYSARFGDPEAQALIPLLEPSTKLAQICLSCTNGTLGSQTIELQQGYACSVTVACEGYPRRLRQSDKIILSTPPPRVNIFHAGTVWEDEKLLTSADRVFSVCAVRGTLEEAVEAAYQGVASISFPGMQYRRDIGSRCLGPSVKEAVNEEVKEEVKEEAKEASKQEAKQE